MVDDRDDHKLIPLCGWLAEFILLHGTRECCRLQWDDTQGALQLPKAENGAARHELGCMTLFDVRLCPQSDNTDVAQAR
jgi:hypothetical protein